ncbi:MAG: dihydroorotase [Lachnospiraceae bacterium]|nr:dihydroorotase [Lachnospiraceae bacterium]
MKILIKSGRVINPATGLDSVKSILINDNKVEKIADYIDEQADYEIDAYGCFVMPGLIDLHVHLREPGFEYKETIETGSQAALKGGFTTVCAMPNTKPSTDCAEVVKMIVDKAATVSPVTVLPVGAVTLGQKGETVTDIKAMKEAGICAISEDGKSVMNSQVYREAMETAAKEGVTVLAHCEDINLVHGGALSEDISNAVEDIIVARDILLAKETGAKLHLCHCSTKDGVEMVRRAKAEGLPVTAEVCPHHFTLCDEDVDKSNANYKMNPPVRSRQDLEALIDAIRNDVVDVIATDHAPHSAEEKARDIYSAPFGIVGLETAVALTITELVEKGVITPMQMAAKMSYNPAKVIGIDRGDISEGKIADITIIDPEYEYTINPETFASKSKNTPFGGKKVKGLVKWVIKDGKVHVVN